MKRSRFDTAVLLGALALLLLMVACGCYMGRMDTAARVSRVQLVALTEYVKTANQAIERDTTLAEEERASWKAVGEKLLRNERDILGLLDREFNAKK